MFAQEARGKIPGSKVTGTHGYRHRMTCFCVNSRVRASHRSPEEICEACQLFASASPLSFDRCMLESAVLPSNFEAVSRPPSVLSFSVPCPLSAKSVVRTGLKTIRPSGTGMPLSNIIGPRPRALYASQDREELCSRRLEPHAAGAELTPNRLRQRFKYYLRI